MSSVTDDPGLTAMDLLAVAIHPDLPEQSVDANADGIGGPVVHRANWNVQILKSLPNSGQIALVSGQTVQGFDDHKLEAPLLGLRQKILHPVSSDERGRCARPIHEGCDDRQSFPVGKRPTNRNLIVDGSISLEVRGESCVDGCSFSVLGHLTEPLA
nr:hypothetical protein [Gymnodinialimonas phycosphaerae]